MSNHILQINFIFRSYSTISLWCNYRTSLLSCLLCRSLLLILRWAWGVLGRPIERVFIILCALNKCKEHRLWGRQNRIPALPLSSCVTLSKLLCLSDPQLPHPSREIIFISWSELYWRFKKVRDRRYLRHCRTLVSRLWPFSPFVHSFIQKRFIKHLQACMGLHSVLWEIEGWIRYKLCP